MSDGQSSTDIQMTDRCLCGTWNHWPVFSRQGFTKTDMILKSQMLFAPYLCLQCTSIFWWDYKTLGSVHTPDELKLNKDCELRHSLSFSASQHLMDNLLYLSFLSTRSHDSQIMGLHSKWHRQYGRREWRQLSHRQCRYTLVSGFDTSTILLLFIWCNTRKIWMQL